MGQNSKAATTVGNDFEESTPKMVGHHRHQVSFTAARTTPKTAGTSCIARRTACMHCTLRSAQACSLQSHCLTTRGAIGWLHSPPSRRSLRVIGCLHHLSNQATCNQHLPGPWETKSFLISARLGSRGARSAHGRVCCEGKSSAKQPTEHHLRTAWMNADANRTKRLPHVGAKPAGACIHRAIQASLIR